MLCNVEEMSRSYGPRRRSRRRNREPFRIYLPLAPKAIHRGCVSRGGLISISPLRPPRGQESGFLSLTVRSEGAVEIYLRLAALREAAIAPRWSAVKL
jgi:hypothetical protein